MVVSGVPEPNQNHASEIVEMSFDMINEISSLKNPSTGKSFVIRIGKYIYIYKAFESKRQRF
jgi:hypothetical protein